MQNHTQQYVKRAADLALAAAILALTTPILLVAVLLVRIRLGSPVFFVQERTGRQERPLRLIKLRTMSDERDASGHLLPDRIRCRGVGLLLRKFSIDELPQLLNVIRGDLSLVGPRPLLPRYDPWYTERERRRFLVRPGITGLAQISGRNRVAWDERLELDVQYVMNWSLRLDLWILVRTVGKVLSRSDVADDPAAEMLDLDRERQLACLPS